MKLVVTIDTEEDNWSRYSAEDNPVTNIERIIHLQNLFDKFAVKPTYLVSYPVATNPRSVAVLKKINEAGKCEIGAHCHPWNTPPFDSMEKIRKVDTMLCNLNEKLQHAKLSSLHEAIQKNFGVTPVSFRAGRFGFGPSVAKSLVKLGYRIDTSVTPFFSWKNYHGPDFSSYGPEPFRFSSSGLEYKTNSGPILEIPVTIGFLQSNFQACHKVLEALEKPFFQKLHAAGILERLRLLNKVWLSPETSDAEEMIRLAKRIEKNKYPVLNLTFHSTSLARGLGPFVKTQADEAVFLKKIESFLYYKRNAGWHSAFLAEI